MAELKDLWIEFPPSNSPDVVGYKLYIEPGIMGATYDSQSYGLGTTTNVNVIDYVDDPGFYSLGITAVDEVSNESEMSRVVVEVELKEAGMGRVKTVTLSFEPSLSPDVVGYVLYMEEAPTTVTYESDSFNLGDSTSVVIADIPNMGTLDGHYNFGITAVDDTGNESDMSLISNVKIDLVPPFGPTNPKIDRT